MKPWHNTASYCGQNLEGVVAAARDDDNPSESQLRLCNQFSSLSILVLNGGTISVEHDWKPEFRQREHQEQFFV
jgi:hypothetical protein